MKPASPQDGRPASPQVGALVPGLPAPLADLPEAGLVAAPALPSLPDLLTLTSYGLGLWWCLGGPTWAAIGSMIGDELDGRLARATKQTSERGSALDWGADVALTPLALARLGRETGHVPLALAAAPPILFLQAEMRSKGERPAIGSARAAIMTMAIIAEHLRR